MKPRQRKLLGPLRSWGWMLRAIVRCARSGWNRGVANWFAQSADITCHVRTIIDKLCGPGPGCRRYCYSMRRKTQWP